MRYKRRCNAFAKSLAAQQFQIGDEKVTITASFGIAGFHGKEIVDFDTLIRRADKALYAAKRSGRNKVKIAPEHAGDV